MSTILQRFGLAALLATSSLSCTTAYDAYGRPIPVVDPGTAVVGAAAVGLLAYGLGERHDRYYRGYGYGYYRAPYYSYHRPYRSYPPYYPYGYRRY